MSWGYIVCNWIHWMSRFIGEYFYLKHVANIKNIMSYLFNICMLLYFSLHQTNVYTIGCNNQSAFDPNEWSKCFQRMLWTLKHNNTSLLFYFFFSKKKKKNKNKFNWHNNTTLNHVWSIQLQLRNLSV